MRPADAIRLLALSALWGGSFIFMRVAAPALGALATAESRVIIASIALLIYAAIARCPLEIRERWRYYFVVGLVNSAIPFALFCWAEIHVSASLAAILNATSPVFGALIGAVWLRDRLSLNKSAGMVVSMLGIVLLVGWQPEAAPAGPIAACLVAAFCYGVGANYAKAKSQGAPAIGTAVGSQIGASLALAPLAPFAWPSAAPQTNVVLCIVALAVLSTALAYVLYFRLIQDIGPTRALTVTFLNPIFGVVWASLFLHEAIDASKVVSMAVVLGGTALVTLGRPAK